MKDSKNKICKRCIYDANVPSITFDSEGICSYCKMSDELKEMYKTGSKENYREDKERW